MEKKIIKIDIGDEKTFDAEYYTEGTTPATEVLAWLVEAIKNGATHVKWHATTDSDCNSESVEAQTYLSRLETDEEFSDREKLTNSRNNAYLIQQKNEELATYERLKKKLGK